MEEDHGGRDQHIVRRLRLIRRIAVVMSREIQQPYIDQEDLFQEGCLGLLRAVSNSCCPDNPGRLIRRSIRLALGGALRGADTSPVAICFTQSSEALDPAVLVEAAESEAALDNVIEGHDLNPIDVSCLKMYFGIDFDRPYTFQEVGRYHGISGQRANQRVRRAILQLRSQWVACLRQE